MNKWIVVTVVFLFSVILRLWNLNYMGRTWDEPAQLIDGYQFIQLIKKADFNNSYWYDHPYHPPLTKYIYGFAGQFDKQSDNKSKEPYFTYGEPTFFYDYTWSRVASVLFSSGAVVLVMLLGIEYFSLFVGVVAGIILAMLPFYVGLSQLATIESMLIFFFTATVYAFLRLLKFFSIKATIVTGILLGFAMETKYTNVLLYPLLLWIYLIWYGSKITKQKLINKKIIWVFVISVVVFFILWPMPWFHLKEMILLNYDLRVTQTSYSVPEVFFGKLILVPKAYYVVQFLITTPFLILALFIAGLWRIALRKNVKIDAVKKIFQQILFRKIGSFIKTFLLLSDKNILLDKRSIWIYYVLIAWFCIPFIQSLYNFRQHGIRYIIEIYAPLSLIAAIGFDYIVRRISSALWVKIVCVIILAGYLFVILHRITPYYLDYFNVVVGGTKNVYEKRLFQLGWWGQGLREAGLYIKKDAPSGSKIGLAVAPVESVPKFDSFVYSIYSNDQVYDYVIVAHYHIIRHGFDDSFIRIHYKPVYKVNADGAVLVIVYKKK